MWDLWNIFFTPFLLLNVQIIVQNVEGLCKDVRGARSKRNIHLDSRLCIRIWQVCYIQEIHTLKSSSNWFIGTGCQINRFLSASTRKYIQRDITAIDCTTNTTICMVLLSPSCSLKTSSQTSHYRINFACGTAFNVVFS